MAATEVEIVERWYDAFNRGAALTLLEELGELLHPEFECDMSRRVLNPVRYRGFDGVQRFIAEMQEIWSVARVETDELLPAENRVLVLNRFSARGASSGAHVERKSAHLWVFEDGLVRRFVLYPDRDEARAAFAAPAA